MSIVSIERIRLGAQARDKQDAITQAGELLVAGGCVAPAYVSGMLAREQTMSTYLGNGVAIPHGQHENLADVRSTGISVLQVPAGSPVLVCRRVTHSVAGKPVLLSEHVFPAHRTEFVVDLPRSERSIAPTGMRLVE